MGPITSTFGAQNCQFPPQIIILAACLQNTGGFAHSWPPTRANLCVFNGLLSLHPVGGRFRKVVFVLSRKKGKALVKDQVVVNDHF